MSHRNGTVELQLLQVGASLLQIIRHKVVESHLMKYIY